MCAPTLTGRRQYLFLFVVYHLVLAPTVGFTLTRQPLLIVMIVIVLMHNTTGAITRIGIIVESLTGWAPRSELHVHAVPGHHPVASPWPPPSTRANVSRSRSRALYGSDAKSKQLQLYIYWFKRSPLWMIINLAGNASLVCCSLPVR